GALCDILTGNNDGQKILEWLEKSNLFITALDENRNWYRYHDLFKAALYTKWKQHDRDSEQELHRRISRWFEQQGFIDEAITHALKGKEWHRALDLMEPIARMWFIKRQHHLAKAFLEQVPMEALETRPEMCLWYGYALIHERQFELAEHPLAIAEKAKEP